MANDILKTLIAEAYGEGPEGMRLVAETILNRAAIRGLSPEQVVRQPKQYTGLEKPGSEAKKAWQNPEALAAAQAAWELAQQPGDPTGGADHYYAQDTISAPWWASGMTPKGEMGGHTFLSSRPLPPGELPEVATALSTVPTPRAPAPVTPSIDMAQMRRISAPSQLIPDTFARLPRSSRTLGDEIGMSPIPGGQQQAPMFDAAFDDRVGAMRLTRQPIDSQGMAVGTSRPPAPVPALPSPQLAARRATDPALQAALNARYPAQLPPVARPMNPQTAASLYAGGGPTRPPTDQVGIAPTGRPMLSNGDGSVSTELSITVTDPRINNGQPTNIPTIWGGRRLNDDMAVNSAMASGQHFQSFPSIAAAERAAQYRSENEILTPMTASDRVRGNPMQTRERATTIATIPTTAFPTTEQIVAATGFRPPPAIPDRLMPGEAGLPALYGGNVAGVGTRGVAPIPFTRPAAPTQFAAAPRVAPVPFQRPTAVGTQLSVRPMPPMPIARPGIGGPFRIAPQPMPASMRPYAGVPQIASPALLAARAVSQSGDTSVGNQADAAAARASGSGGRNRRY